MGTDQKEVVFVDGIQALGVHNGVARILMMRLGTDGKPMPALELLMPVTQTKTFIDVLSKAGKK